MPKQTTETQAAIYARVSTEDQGENNSIPDQLFVCREYAAQQSLHVVQEYIDMESGLKGSRTHIDALIADAAQGSFSTVIVKKIDRLARGPRAFYRIMDQLDSAGVQVKFAAEDYPEEVIPFLVAFGGFEVRMITERTAAGRRTRARAGKIQRPPKTLFGYDYDEESERFVINEDEAQWVRQIFAWHCEGLGIGRIARRLNAQDIETKTVRLLRQKLARLDDPAWLKDHKRIDPEQERARVRSQLAGHHGWYDLVIYNLLRNTSYYGEGFVNRHTTRGGKSILRPREEWIPFAYPSIIDRETFETAQRMTIQIRNYRELKRTDRSYMLRGLLYCAECQKSFVITYVPWHTILRDGTKKTYDHGTRGYKCRGMRYHRHLYNCRQPANVVARRVEQAVWEKVRSFLQNPELVILALHLEHGEATAAVHGIEEGIQRIQSRLEELDLQTQRILRLYATGKWKEVDLDLQRTVIAEEREALEQELTEKRAAAQQQLDQQEVLRRVASIAQTIEHLPCSVEEMTPHQYEHATIIVKLIVERVLLDGAGKLTIEMAIREDTVETAGENAGCALAERSQVSG